MHRLLIAVAVVVAAPLAWGATRQPVVLEASAPALARAAHGATALPGGTVLVTGGCVVDGCSRATATSELWRARTGFAPGPRLTVPRAGHTATALPGGTVLLAGGYRAEGTSALASAEVCSRNRCRSVGRLSTGRGGHSAVALASGDALVAGGAGPGGIVASVERYDRLRGSFVTTAPLGTARQAHTATLLRDGRVLVVGGYGEDGRAIGGAELYDPQAETWQPAGSLARARGKHAAIRLRDGRVLVLGGAADSETRARLRSTELFDPETSRFAPGPRLRVGRYKIVDAVTLLDDGRVVVGGDARIVEVVSAEADGVAQAGGRLRSRSAFATATRTPQGALLVGGYDERIAIRAEAYVVRP